MATTVSIPKALILERLNQYIRLHHNYTSDMKIEDIEYDVESDLFEISVDLNHCDSDEHRMEIMKKYREIFD
ncbi:hypothetical protein [Vibrio sp. 10N.261.46.A3]|uniref:hypothetical protein n=1 Tax=Vibrio sp. 10N.261.46.A3 TaxID=3229658 RepID=UPI00354C7888